MTQHYALRLSQRRASSEIADVAGVATYGLVDTVLVDIDEVVPAGSHDSGPPASAMIAPIAPAPTSVSTTPRWATRSQTAAAPSSANCHT